MTSDAMTPPAGSGRIHAGEGHALALSTLYFFCVLAAYYVIRPMRDQLSAAVGSTQLPRFYAATFLATLLLTPLFAWLATRHPRRVLVPVVYGFFIACLLVFVPLFRMQALLDARVLGTVFFVWLSVFSLFVVSVFWSFMADIWNAAQARRLFPLIALGGTAGAIAGPAATRSLVEVIGVAPLLLVSAALLGVALACAVVLGRWAHAGERMRATAATGAAVRGDMFDGLRQVFADPFIRSMALLMLLGDAIGTINYALVTDYSGATFTDAVSRTRFAAGLDLATNLLQTVLQLTLTRWLLVRHGAAPVIATWAVITAAMLLWTAFAPDPYASVVGAMPVVALALVVSRGLAYGMLGPARESLFTQVPRELRYLGKNAVDTAVWRFGDLAAASAMNLLRSIGATAGALAAFGACGAAIAGAVGWRLARRADATLEPSALPPK
jgi:ATP:ADP antiporter, AAA family